MKRELLAKDSFRFDEALKEHKSGDTLALEPGGTFYSKGTAEYPERAYISFPGDSALHMNGARLAFHPQLTKPAGSRNLRLIAFGPRVEICGANNSLGLPGTLDLTAPDGFNSDGPRFWGRFEITKLHIKGQRGSKADGVESFTLSAECDTGGSLVANVTAEADSSYPDSYVSGIYVGATQPTSAQSLVRNCDTTGLGPDAWFDYSATNNVRFAECKGGAQKFFYNDTGNATGIVLHQCTSTGALWAAISVVAITPGMRFEVDAYSCDFGKCARLVEVDDRVGDLRGLVAMRYIKAECEYLIANTNSRGVVVAFARSNEITGERKIFAPNGNFPTQFEI